ncbi:MAG TPA: peptidase domain-containing ABC transporter [Stellaceae bacterium]|nr:peptidase domain-containing ABC transporter [Stellaceae bacterium]
MRAHPFEGAEPSNQTIVSMGAANGLRVEPMQLKRGDLAKLKRATPAMLRFPDGRSLVLVRVNRVEGEDVAILRDPYGAADALVGLGEDRLFDTWQGDLMLVKRHFAATDEERPFGFLWLLGQLLVEKQIFRDVALGAIVNSVLMLAPMVMVIIAMDRVLLNQSWSTLEVLVIFIAVVVIFETILEFLKNYLISAATNRIDARLNLYVFDKLLNLPISFFESTTTGRINGKISEIWRIRNFLTGQGFETVVEGLSIFIFLPVMFVLNWKLTFVIIAMAGLIAGIYAVFIPPIRRQHGRVVRAEMALRSHEVESIHGMRTVKSLALDGLKRHERDRLVARAVEERIARDMLANYPRTLVKPIDQGIYAVSILLACYMVLSGDNTITPGMVIAGSMVARRAAQPLIAVASLLQQIEEVRGAVVEVGSVVNVPPERGRSLGALRLPFRGGITFDSVRFRYSAEAPYALDRVSFDIPAGTIFGVMGRSGSGKTTVTRLLQGLHYDYEGMIKIDGMDLKEIDVDHLRSHVGVVLQENFLFNGTIRENIAAVKPNARFDEIARAAQLAGAEEFIERLPRGYETMIEEGAANLSGGQRQRMAIARALLIDPPILILDEATSALDAESEAIVNANLMRMAVGRTVIIISHRLSSLMASDQILVLERGKVYDIGTHETLLNRCDIYKHLWYQQNRHLQPDGPHVRIALP